MSTPLLDQILTRFNALPTDQRDDLERRVLEQTGHMRFIPNQGPQRDAVESKADILLYGGEAGGGKSALLVGLAFTAHRKSLLMRRKYTELSGLIQEAWDFNGGKAGYNGSNPPRLEIDDERTIQFGAVNEVGDEQNWKGRARDFLGLDEAVDFEEQQVRFLMGWVRTKVAGQRARTILATNPPVGGQGQWIIKMFRPWLDVTHPNPAKHGELRWFIVDDDGSGNSIDIEVDGPYVEFRDKSGELLKPKSRTFIPARLSDNPYYAGSDYKSTLDALPEPYRTAYRDGNFFAGVKDKERQICPSDWVRQAQKRWKPNGGQGVAMSCMASDIAQGGKAENVIAFRHLGWYGKLIATKGKDTPDGSGTAGLILSQRTDNCRVVIDMGGGYGGEVFRILKDNGIEVIAYKGNNTSLLRTTDGQLKFANKRSASLWKFREALDPNQPGGSNIALDPEDQLLFQDLTTPTFTVTTRGITAETKEDVIEKLGRSPDRGDSVIMAWSEGPKTVADPYGSGNGMMKSNVPQVVMGHQAKRGGANVRHR